MLGHRHPASHAVLSGPTTPAKRENAVFLVTMLGASFCLGLVPFFEKLGVQSGAGIFPLTLCINLSTVLFLALPGWRKRPAPLTLRWRVLLLIGFVASGLVVYLNIWALQTTSATHRSVFQAMYPASTLLFAFWLLDERLPARGCLVLFGMIGGLLLLAGQGMAMTFVFGDLLLFATLPLMGLSDAWAKKGLGDLSPSWVALGRFAFGALLLLILGSVVGEWEGWPRGIAWLWVALSGLTIAFGIRLLYRGMDLKGATLAASLVSLAPVVTLSLDTLWLDESFSPLELLGLAIVVGGAGLLSHPRFQGRARNTRTGRQ